MQLSGKTILLTGGSAGIGREMARQIKAKGARVILTGRNPERLAAMRAEGFEALEADLSNPAGVDALIAVLGDAELDVLINNAGQLVDHDFRRAAPDADAADEAIYANLSAPIRLITALVPRLRPSAGRDRQCHQRAGDCPGGAPAGLLRDQGGPAVLHACPARTVEGHRHSGDRGAAAGGRYPDE